MAPNKIVVLCGLPGAGKTTLATYLQETSGFYFANVGADPRFSNVPMWQLAADLYRRHGKGRHLVTEGVLITRARRDSFSDRIWKDLCSRNPNVMSKPRLFLLREDIQALNHRRPSRSVAAYTELEEALEEGSDRFDVTEIDSSITSVDDRARFILETLCDNEPVIPCPG